MKVYGYSPFGYEGAVVTVEADIRHGIPAVDIVGLADGSVKEARERVKAAIKNSGFDFPEGRVLISLSPADLKKKELSLTLRLLLRFSTNKILWHMQLTPGSVMRSLNFRESSVLYEELMRLLNLLRLRVLQRQSFQLMCRLVRFQTALRLTKLIRSKLLITLPL